jgi:hypothetical protein
LFNLYINDICNVLQNGVNIALFADDAKIWKSIHSLLDSRNMQDTLDKLLSWSQTWGMTFNSSKCKVLTMRPRLTTDYVMNSHVLENVLNFCDLGVTITSDFTWAKHIEIICSKARRNLGLIRRCLGTSAPKRCKRILYIAMVKSVLMTNSVIWSPSVKKHIRTLENIQRYATRFISGLNMGYLERMQDSGLTTLAYARDKADLVMVYSLIHHKFNVNSSLLINKPAMPYRTRNAVRGLNLFVPNARNATVRNWFLIRGPSIWNVLPDKIKGIDYDDTLHDGTQKFKKAVYIYLYEDMHRNFRIESMCSWRLLCQCYSCKLT